MGATASIVILTVFLVRALMHRFPQKYAYLLWVIVGIRLICPFALSSSISLFNLKPLADSRNATEPYTLTYQQQTKPSDCLISDPAFSLPVMACRNCRILFLECISDPPHEKSACQSRPLS